MQGCGLYCCIIIPISFSLSLSLAFLLQQYFLSSEGYEEECYFDFTFSPIFLKDGSVGGILAVVQEVTQSILNQRRLSTLNQFSKQAPLIQSVDGAYSMITTILQEANNLDVPFSIVYRTKENKDSASSTFQATYYSPNPTPQNTSFAPQQQEDSFTTGTLTGTRQAPYENAISKVTLIRSHTFLLAFFRQKGY